MIMNERTNRLGGYIVALQFTIFPTETKEVRLKSCHNLTNQTIIFF